MKWQSLHWGPCICLPQALCHTFFQPVHQGRSQGSTLGYVNGKPITYSKKSLHLLGGTNHGVSPVTTCSGFLGGGGTPCLVKDVTTISNALTQRVALLLLHLGMVVSEASNKVPDQVMMLNYGTFIEGTTVQELSLTPGRLGGGCTHKQIFNTAPYQGGHVPDAVSEHSLVVL